MTGTVSGGVVSETGSTVVGVLDGMVPDGVGSGTGSKGVGMFVGNLSGVFG